MNIIYIIQIIYINYKNHTIYNLSVCFNEKIFRKQIKTSNQISNAA